MELRIVYACRSMDSNEIFIWNEITDRGFFFVFWFPLSTPPRERSNSSKNSRPRTRFRFDAALYELKAKIERGLALCLLSRVAMATSRGIVCPWFPGKQSHFYVHECVWEPAECTRMVLEYIECTLFYPCLGLEDLIFWGDCPVQRSDILTKWPILSELCGIDKYELYWII